MKSIVFMCERENSMIPKRRDRMMKTIHRKINCDIKTPYPLLFRLFGCKGD